MQQLLPANNSSVVPITSYPLSFKSKADTLLSTPPAHSEEVLFYFPSIFLLFCLKYPQAYAMQVMHILLLQAC